MRKLMVLSLLLLTLSACALFPNRDPVNINVVGIEPPAKPGLGSALRREAAGAEPQ